MDEGADFIAFDLDFDDDTNDQEQGQTREEGETTDEPTIGPTAKEKRFSGRDQRDNQYPFQSVDVLVPIPIPPWVPYNPNYSHDLLVKFHEEIDDYLKFIKPTTAEHHMRMLTVNRIRKVVQSIWPKAELCVFGSFDTKLYLPSSDIDVVVLDDSAHLPRCLYQLRVGLYKNQIANDIEVIAKARVPIIKLKDALTGYAVDISFNLKSGIQGAAIVKSFLEDKEYGLGIETLMMILKQFLAQRHLNEVFSGGLGSYGLLIMIASFLKLHPKVQNGDISIRDNLGVLLLDFFDLYGKAFNYQEVGIAVDNEKGYYYRKKDKGFYNFHRQNQISIMDPQDSSNDVGKGSYNFGQVKHEFAKASNTLTAMIGKAYEERDSSKRRYEEKYERSNKRKGLMISLLGSIISIRPNVLEQRERVQDLYDELVSKAGGDVNKAMGYIKNPSLGKKRHERPETQNGHKETEMAAAPSKKRKADEMTSKKDPPEVIYIHDSSDSDHENYGRLQKTIIALSDVEGESKHSDENDESTDDDDDLQILDVQGLPHQKRDDSDDSEDENQPHHKRARFTKIDNDSENPSMDPTVYYGISKHKNTSSPGKDPSNSKKSKEKTTRSKSKAKNKGKQKKKEVKTKSKPGKTTKTQQKASTPKPKQKAKVNNKKKARKLRQIGAISVA